VSCLQDALPASKIQAAGFPPENDRRGAGRSFGILSWAALVCGVVIALAVQRKELGKEDGEPRSKEVLVKHKESVPPISASSTKKIPPAHQSWVLPVL